MNDKYSSKKSVRIMEEVLSKWKNNMSDLCETKKVNAKPLAISTKGDVELQFIITLGLGAYHTPQNITVKSEPFITTTLGNPPISTDIKGEIQRLQVALKDVDERFKKLVATEF